MVAEDKSAGLTRIREAAAEMFCAADGLLRLDLRQQNIGETLSVEERAALQQVREDARKIFKTYRTAASEKPEGAATPLLEILVTPMGALKLGTIVSMEESNAGNDSTVQAG